MESSDRKAMTVSAPAMLLAVVFLIAGGAALLALGARDLDAGRGGAGSVAIATVAIAIGGVSASGFLLVQPNHAKVLIFFGRYMGTVRTDGWFWSYPLTMHKRISLRIRNFESEVLKVNDAIGSPVEISAVIVWRVVDMAKATLDVEDYEHFVRIQTETAVRHVASLYPYDVYEAGQPSLRANADDVTATLQAELQSHLDQAGVQIVDTRLRRLAYAPEIAADMLRRQQAEAVVAARTRIVDGAVGMVEAALDRLSRQHVVELDEERKAAMVSNLLVVLCSEHHAQPVVNAGTLYQ